MCIDVVIPITDTTKLAAAKDGAIDARTAFDGDIGLADTTGQDVLIVIQVATTAAEDVTETAIVLKNGTLGIIAEDENLLKQALRYLKKLASKKQDETLMTEEQFFARVDKAKQGKSAVMLPNENLTEFLRRQGYEL